LRRDARIRPEGRATGSRAFFDQHKDVLSKNPANPADPARSAGRNRRGVLSLGHSFFAQAKKGGSLAAASETKGREDSLDDHCSRIDQQQIPRPWLRMTEDGQTCLSH
jgi:hypothetical protein